MSFIYIKKQSKRIAIAIFKANEENIFPEIGTWFRCIGDNTKYICEQNVNKRQNFPWM